MENLELIEKYLNEELSQTELAEFEQLQKTDAAFAEEVQMAIAINADFNVQQKKRWQKLIEAKETPVRQLNPRNRSINWIRSIAAVFILGLGLALGWMLFAGQSVDKMATKYLTEHHADPTSFVEDKEDAWSKAIYAYEDGNFSQAVTAITNSIDKNPKNLDMQYFYLGLSHLYEGSPNYDNAITSLKKSQELNPNHLRNSAINWHLALAYIKKGNLGTAKSLLQKVIDNKNDDWKKDEATALLNKL